MQAASGKIFSSSDSTETTCLLRHMEQHACYGTWNNLPATTQKQSACDNTETICLREQRVNDRQCGLPDSQDTVAIILDLVLLFGCDIDCKVIRTLGIYLHEVRAAGDIKLMPVVGHCAPAFGGDDKIAEI